MAERVATARASLALLDNRRDKMAQEVEQLTKRLNTVGNVDEWRNGQPIIVEKRNKTTWEMSSVRPYNERWVEIYRSAHDNKHWAITIQERRGCFTQRFHGGNHRGHHWKRRKDVVEAAKEWVARGTIPLYNGKPKDD